ncbi:MAG: hypothetical protein KC425_26315, partial [Anaerolineales bacterium]|nr:hypothetical protein [Anaerolineales bacterium]
MLTTLVAAVWPLLAGAIGLPGGGGGAAGVSVPTVTLPFAVGGATEMNGLLALGVLTVAVIALVAGMGAVLGFIYVFLNRQTDTIKESEAFQTHQAALAQQEKAQIERLRAGRTTHPVPEHKMPRWSVLSTSLIVLFFTVMLGTLLVEVLIPVDTLWA